MLRAAHGAAHHDRPGRSVGGQRIVEAARGFLEGRRPPLLALRPRACGGGSGGREGACWACAAGISFPCKSAGNGALCWLATHASQHAQAAEPGSAASGSQAGSGLSTPVQGMRGTSIQCLAVWQGRPVARSVSRLRIRTYVGRGRHAPRCWAAAPPAVQLVSTLRHSAQPAQPRWRSQVRAKSSRQRVVFRLGSLQAGREAGRAGLPSGSGGAFAGCR